MAAAKRKAARRPPARKSATVRRKIQAKRELIDTGTNKLFVRRAVADPMVIELRKRLGVAAIDEQAVGHVEKVVPARTVDGPIGRDDFVHRENFLAQHVQRPLTDDII